MTFPPSLHRITRTVIILACFVIAGTSFAGVLADSNADFSATQGQKNWYYGYFPGGDINDFTQLPTYNEQAQRWQHAIFGPPWTLVGAYSAMHPNGATSGTEEWADREWVSTYTGAVVISGKLAKASYAAVPASTGIYGRIYKNHQLMYEHFVAGTDSVGVNYSLNLSLAAGDVLDFAVGPNGVDASDATVFSTTIWSAQDSVTVDFGSYTPVTPGLGMLNGFEEPGTPGAPPPGNLVTPLQLRFWRGDPSIYSRVRSIAPAIPFEMLLLPGVPATNYGGLGPPWLNWPGYESLLSNLVSPFVPLPANVTFEPFNEPQDGWASIPGSPGYQEFWNGSAQNFYDSYLHAFQTIRRVLGPKAQIAGPSFGLYDHQGIQEFLEYCLANGCEVNSLTWHDENDSSASASPASSIGLMASHVLDARVSFLQNPRYAPLNIRRIDINEIVGSLFIHQPAGTLAYYAALETSGADYGAHSCWTLATGVNECFNGTLSGLLTTAFQPRSVWWLHKSYADGVAGRAHAVSLNPDVVALASTSLTSASTPQILVGNSNYQDTIANTPHPVNVNLSLTNLQSVPAIGQASNIGVRVELIPNTGEAALSQLPLVAEMNAFINGGSAQIELPPLQVGEVFRITLVPPAPQVATITAGGILDPWNYTQGAAPGAWITIVGTNFGPTVPQSWNPTPSAPLPTNLGGVSVNIGGEPAALSYASSSQINALVPAGTPFGANPVVVMVNGSAGNPYVLQVDSTHPAIYALANAAEPVGFYVTAALSGTSNLIGKPGADPRVTRGAHPGEQVDLYMVGLGATQDPTLFITSQLFSEAATLATTVTVDLGGQMIVPSFAGLVSPGLYVVRFTVPQGTVPGDLPIWVNAGGIFTPENVYFTVSPN
jgi:xylan 1,4-beta-xylosidase